MGEQSTPEILLSTTQFFKEVVDEAFVRLKVKTSPLVTDYLVSLLDYYAVSDNLYEQDELSGKRSLEPLAEMYLRSQSMERVQKQEMLKKLGDTSLYISGFFGDSLRKKVVDLDYYADLGGTAYGTLASYAREDIKARMFDEFANHFVQFVDVLTYISQKSMLQKNSDILRLYDRYLKTGSELAKEQLAESGLLNNEVYKRKKATS